MSVTSLGDEYSWTLPEFLWVNLPSSLVGELYEGHLVPIKLHYLLLVIPAMSCASSLMSDLGASGFFLTFFVTGPLLFLLVLVHEIGHMVGAARCGCRPEYILLWPMGGLAVISDYARTPKERAYISAMGPMTHLPMFFAWMLLLLMSSGTVTLSLGSFYLNNGFADWFSILCVQMMLMNLVTFLFNLFVPCYPLDCSQICINAGLVYGWEELRIAWTMVYVSVPMVLGLLIWGLYDLITAGRGITTVLVALFLGSQTYTLYQCLQEGQLARHPLFQKDQTERQGAAPASAAAPGAMPGAVAPSEPPPAKFGENVDLALLLALGIVLGV